MMYPLLGQSFRLCYLSSKIRVPAGLASSLFREKCQHHNAHSTPTSTFHILRRGVAHSSRTYSLQRRPSFKPLPVPPLVWITPLRLEPCLTSTEVASQKRKFHASGCCRAPPIFALIGLLKSSTILGIVQTVGRIFLSLFPALWIKGKFFKMTVQRMDVVAYPALMGKRDLFRKYSRWFGIGTSVLLIIPFVLVGVVLIASSERTPLTGRWRTILLSPAEEELISADLRGHKWYDTVRSILTQSSGGQMPTIMPYNDWRWSWVDQTLRKLEQSVVMMSDAEAYRQAYERAVAGGPGVGLYPPPPRYPLVPRARATSLLHEAIPHSDLDHDASGDPDPDHHQTHHVAPHTLLGPPYSLLIVNKDESNAFSYGFGPGGAGGVVLYSGFLDDILGPPTVASLPDPSSQARRQQPQQRSPPSLLSRIFSSPSSSPPTAVGPPPTPTPTAEQTARLAALLAHELSHLILSHHIESLSSGTILMPSLISIVIDSVRTVLFPITALFGPFVMDALDRTLRSSVNNVSNAGEACKSRQMEIEADVISVRLLALAGFDPTMAVGFWEERLKSQGAPDPVTDTSSRSPSRFWHQEGTHPVWEERVLSLKKELASWQVEKTRTLQRMKKSSS